VSEEKIGAEENLLVPEKRLASPRSVEEAALMVMAAEPSKLTPLIARVVASLVAVPALPEIEPVIREEKVLEPEKVLASPRSVVDAIVMFPVPSKETPLMVRAFASFVAEPALPAKVLERLVKEFTPVNEFESPRSVEDAAVIVMAAEPSKLTPLIARVVASLVAVPAFPEIEPVMRFEKMLLPEKVLASESKVEDAAVATSAEQVTVPIAETPETFCPAEQVWDVINVKSVPLVAAVRALAPLPLRRPVREDKIGALVMV
jgi:hypothetical protein